MEKTITFLEALRTLKEWSILIIGIQTVLFIVLLSIAAFGNREQVRQCRNKINRSVLCAALSIIVGFNVVGTIPWSTQHISEFAAVYGDIYQFKNYLNIKIWIIAFTQHMLAVAAIVYVLMLVYQLTHHPNEDK